MSAIAGTVGSVLNRFRPVAVLLVLLAALVAASGAGARATATPVERTALDHALLTQINAFRTAHGLHTLTLSRKLDAAARQHSHEMAVVGYFGHDSANGESMETRLMRYYPYGNGLWSVGENLLWASPTISAKSALRTWVASPPHLQNLLNPSWRQIGISAVYSASAPGYYRNKPVTVITTDFGVRR
jgi:uncharacterized protein YkwD